MTTQTLEIDLVVRGELHLQDYKNHHDLNYIIFVFLVGFEVLVQAVECHDEDILWNVKFGFDEE